LFEKVSTICHQTVIIILLFCLFKHLLWNNSTMSNQARGRNWCFTYNNPSGSIDVDINSEDRIVYACWQLEVGDNGTEHFQGYLEFDRPVTRGQIKKIFLCNSMHLEPRMGTREEARDYCRKEDSRLDGPWEKGVFDAMRQGKRNDLTAMKNAIDKGDSLRKISDEHFGSFLRYNRGIDRYMQLHRSGRNFKTEVYVFIGMPRTGKSTMALDWGGADAYWLPRGTWFDGYDGHDSVIIDDFYGWLPCDLLLRACDRFPLMVPIKGGHVNFVPHNLIITSNKLPHMWYSTAAWDWRAFAGRVNAYYFFEDPDFEAEPVRFEKYEDLVSYYNENYVNAELAEMIE